MTRTILYTGKGGVGKTSVAAATARACAAAGQRTLVLSTDPAHSLGDVLELEIGADPTPVADRLDAQQISAQTELERNWSGVQGWLSGLLADYGMNRIAAEELTVPPGTDELFSLLTLKEHVDNDQYDVLVVDCAPTGETLRLLSFPDVAQWWLGKVFGKEHQLMAAARPLAKTFFDVTLPDETVFREVNQLIRNLIVLNEVLRSSETSVRLVMTPDRLVIAEAMRTYTYLSLYGFLTDAVVVNRVFPEEVDGYFGAWRERQQAHLVEVEDGFAPVPVLRAPYFATEVVGSEMLDTLGASLFDGVKPDDLLHDRISQELEVTDGEALLRVELPFADKGDVTLRRVGDTLVVAVGDRKRSIALPAALAAYRPAGASFTDGGLEVRFTS